MATTTYKIGNVTVIVHDADITPEERQRRIEKEVKPALAAFGRTAYERGIDLAAYSAQRRAGRSAKIG